MKNLMLKVSTDLPDWCNSPQVREFGFGYPGNFCMWNRESWTLESRMPLTIGIRNPSFIEKDLESSNWNPESTAWNSDSKNVLEGPYIRRCNDPKINMVAETQRATRFPWLVFILNEITNVVFEKFKKEVSSLIEWNGVILLWNNNKLFCWWQETGYTPGLRVVRKTSEIFQQW